MDYEIRIKDRGLREKSLKALDAALDSLGLPIQIDEVRDEGDYLVVDFDVDLDGIIRWALLHAFRRNPIGRRFVSSLQIGAAQKRRRARSGGKFKADDPKTPLTNEAWVGGKAPPKKKAAPKKKASAKKAAPKKKAKK